MIHEIKRFVLIGSPVDRVWSAITTEAELSNWFCRGAEVELKEGGIYHLDSRVPNATGRHRIRLIEENRALGLDWMIHDHPTEVRLLLEDFEGLTRVTAAHRVEDDFPAMRTITDSLGTKASYLEYLWCYAFILLKSYLRDAKTELQLKDEEDPLGIEWQVTIAAPLEQVFQSLVDPEELRKWNPNAGEVRIEPREGGRYSFGWPTEEQGTDGPDEIVEYKEGYQLTYTWHGQDPKTLVSWTAEPLEEGRTRLHFRHSGFLKNPKVVLEYKLGWAHFIYALKMSVEAGQKMDDWNGRAK